MIHLYFSNGKEVKQTLCEVLQSVSLSAFTENCAFQTQKPCIRTKHPEKQKGEKRKKGEGMKEREKEQK